MPLLASFIGTVVTALAGFFSRFVVFNLALKLASYTAWIVVVAAFATTVFICLSSLSNAAQGMVSGARGWGSIPAAFLMGVSMFIPANAGAVLSCLASIWIGCQIYKLQKQGIHNYSK